MNLRCKTQIKWIFSSNTLHGDLKRRNSSILSLFWLKHGEWVSKQPCRWRTPQLRVAEIQTVGFLVSYDNEQVPIIDIDY